MSEVFLDNDISAARHNGSVKPRPKFDAMQQGINTGGCDAVWTWDLDRLFRDPLEQEQFFLLCYRSGMYRLATTGDDVNIDTGEGMMVARIKGAVNAEEVRKITKRVRRKHEELAQDGKLSGGGHRPFGYEKDRVTIQADEAGLIRDAAARVLAGESIRSVVLAWNTKGIPTVRGGPWSSTTLKRLLMSGRISGQREHHGEIVAMAQWPGIITTEQTERLRAVLGDSGRFTGGGAVARSYLLSGLLRCGACEAKMTARPIKRKGHAYRRYVCAVDRGGCGRVGIGAEPLEALVTEAVLIRLDSAEVAAAMSDHDQGNEVAALRTQIEADRQGLADLTHACFVDRIVPQSEFISARKPLEERLASAQSQLRRAMATADTFAGQGHLLRERWPTLSLERRRAVITTILDHVSIAATTRANNRFDPQRVDIRWHL